MYKEFYKRWFKQRYSSEMKAEKEGKNWTGEEWTEMEGRGKRERIKRVSRQMGTLKRSAKCQRRKAENQKKCQGRIISTRQEQKIELHEEKCKKYQELQFSEDNKTVKILRREEKNMKTLILY